MSNVTALWRRWHCSVAEWLRDEIVIPLGEERQLWRNYFLTFAYCGFLNWPLLWTRMVTHVWQRFWHPRRLSRSRLILCE